MWYEPKDFTELVEIMRAMNDDEYVENDDTGKLRKVCVGGTRATRYELYEENEFLGSTPDVVSAASFIAKGWDKYDG